METLKPPDRGRVVLELGRKSGWVPLRRRSTIRTGSACLPAKTKGCLSRQTALAMVFKLAKSAERHWRRLNGCERLAQLIQGVLFHDGEPVQAAEEQVAA